MSDGEMKWGKLSVDFINDTKIRYIKSLPEGHQLVWVWIGLLCLAVKTNDKGYIYISRELAYDDKMLAVALDVKEDIVKLSKAVFKKMGMIDVEEDGKIFLENYMKYNNGSDKLAEIRESTRLRVAKHRAKALCSGEIDKEIEIEDVTVCNVTETLQQFNEWWHVYPKKVAKGQAVKAYKSALKKAEASVLLNGARKMAARLSSGKIEKQYIPNPATWLNGERWLDEDTTSNPEPERWGQYA